MTHHSAGEGSVSQRPNGLWQAALMVEGKRKTVYGKTRQEVADKLRTLKRGSAPALTGTVTVSEFMAHWLETVTPTLKPRTVQDYTQVLAAYILPELGAVRLSKLKPPRLQKLYADLQARGLERAPAKAHMVLHRAFHLAVLWGMLDDNPCERVIKPAYHAKRRELWSAWELNAFMAGARAHWLGPLWATALTSGCRIGELCALTWADVDLHAGTVRIAKTLHRIQGAWVVTTPKTKAGARVIALPAEGIDALNRQQTQQGVWQTRPDWQGQGLVFCKRTGAYLLEQNVAHALHALCVDLGIRPLTNHDLRHMSASLLLANGAPITAVSARLGHGDSSITLRTYAHAIGHADRDAAETLGRALRGATG